MARLIVSGPAKSDLREIYRYSKTQFGAKIAKAYNALIAQSFRDILEDPFCIGSKDRQLDLDRPVRSYAIDLSKARIASPIKRPKHTVFYALFSNGDIMIVRVLHQAQDIALHITPEN